ncbi:hypothetical protein [Desulfovibrio sp.]|uniref:hypothetical protein n=1 Tax=Desulfovibrio sp. TaxID=885 RepID=UPI0025B7EF75|nr:hypothetical protein [Desulfovibrio sp.]
MWNSENIWKSCASLPQAVIAGRRHAAPGVRAGLRLCALLVCAALLVPGTPAAAHGQETQQSAAASAAPGGEGGREPSAQEQPETLPPELAEGPVEVRELWTGSLYSSTYKVGLCFSADGKVRGVVHLRLYNGKVDVYHIVGSVQNNEIQARHSSGHTFKGRLVSANKVEGVIKLKSGMKVRLEGTRTHDVPLAPENCAPLPQ